MNEQPRPYALAIDAAAIDDLKQRLARTRWPDQAPGPAWATGTDLSWLKSLTAYWRDGFDWRAQEALLNAWPQWTCRVHGIDLHWLQAQGRGPAPLPLLLSHGWPGSVFEFIDILPLLADPAAHGGDAADAFTVIAPSLPGYGLSFSPGQPRFSIEQIADCLATLMADVLGHRRFATQGGDWGAYISARMGYAHPDKTIGVHLNLMPTPRDPGVVMPPTPENERYLAQLQHWLKEESGYSLEQATRPQTLAYALTDSPAGLAAWIAEKFRTWSDCDGDIDGVFSRDRLLANISLYWFTGAIGSSFWPYYARQHGGWPIPVGATVDVPVAYCDFPREIVNPPRSLAERTYKDIRRWTRMPRGGHFAAMEQPQALAEEIRAFYRPLRH
jgi:pimeloyl-ACP methyl ester carboxylesterase